jgi:uncharacterized protein (TIGR03437 family)
VRSVAYQLRVVSDAPAIAQAGVVSAATWQAGPVSPGQIVIVGGSGFGADPLTTAAAAPGDRIATTLADTRILFDGEPGPLLWVKSGQAAVLVPSGVATRSTTQVVVEFRGRQSSPLPVAVQQATPGLFTASGAGTGSVAALNTGGSANGQRNPAERGSVIVIYATGLGLMTPPAADGALITGIESRPELPVTVSFGGFQGTVEYVGGVPGQVAGLFQLNVRIPTEIQPGEIPVAVLAGNFSSPMAGVTVSVR